ncbi:MAG: YfbU family protein, partial [Aeromonas veronii]
MNMSNTERLILSNQYEILAKLNPEKADVYQRASTIIERGYCLQILELEKSFG